MTQSEIRDFKKFMNDQDAFMVFEKTYNENRMTFNPKKLEDYLELTRADIVIPQAFIYPKGIYGKDFWMTLNMEWTTLLKQKRAEHSEAVQLSGLDLEVIDVAKKLSTHMLVTRSRKTKDVVLMFNRQRGIEVKFKPGSNGLLFNNVELCNKLIELLELDPEKEYFQLGIELLDETKDYLLFLLKKTK